MDRRDADSARLDGGTVTSQDLARVVAQANAIGKPHGLFCCYKADGRDGFVWIFYRRGPMGPIRLGRTAQASRVVQCMERYAATVGASA